MTLDLNETVQPYRDFHTDKTPRYIDQMPLLISGKNLDGEIVDVPREPCQVADIFERRVNSSKPDWMNYWFHTIDGIVIPAKGAYTEGRFKIRRNSESLRGVAPESESTLIDGGLPVDYESVPGVEFRIRDVIVNRDLTRDEARESPVLLELLGQDSSFRDIVVNKIFDEGKRQFDYNTMMGLFLPHELQQAHERALFVSRLNGRSSLDGSYALHYDCGRLVGFLASETPSASGTKILEEKLEKVISPALEQVLAITKRYVPEVAREQFEEEIRKLYC